MADFTTFCFQICVQQIRLCKQSIFQPAMSKNWKSSEKLKLKLKHTRFTFEIMVKEGLFSYICMMSDNLVKLYLGGGRGHSPVDRMNDTRL